MIVTSDEHMKESRISVLADLDDRTRMLDDKEPLKPVECLRLRPRSRRQLVEQRLRLFQVARIKPLDEPAIDGSEKLASPFRLP